MRLELRIESLTGEVVGPVPALRPARIPAVISFEARQSPSASLTPRNPFLELNAADSALSTQLAELNASSSPLKIGTVKLRGFSFLGQRSLPLSLDSRFCVIDQALGWSGEHVDADDSISGRIVAGELVIDLDLDQLAWISEAVVLSAPGQDVYGHWLLDFIPRLSTARAMNLTSKMVLINQLPKWAAVFLRAFEINPARVFSLTAGVGVSIETAYVPTFMKDNAYIGYPEYYLAMQEFIRYVLAIPLLDSQKHRLPKSSRLFVIRGGRLTRARQIDNIDEICGIAASKGFVVISPEQFSVREQVHIFREAKLVVGEDGSALHNVAFATEGCVLGVLAGPGRLNPFHAGICRQMAHRISYLQVVQQGPYNAICDPRTFNAFIDQLDRFVETGIC